MSVLQLSRQGFTPLDRADTGLDRKEKSVTWVQFWLLTAAIYDAAYRQKHGDRYFIITILVCLGFAISNWIKSGL